jgi:hypothetical protein
VLDDPRRDRERAVVVVEEIDDARLLGPVGVRRGHDLPEASAAGAGVGRDPVAVAVTGYERDHRVVALQEAAHRLVGCR